MSFRSLSVALILALVFAFGGIWIYKRGWEAGNEAQISPQNYISQRQAWRAQNPRRVGTQQPAEPVSQTNETVSEQTSGTKTSKSDVPAAQQSEGLALRQTCLADWRRVAAAEIRVVESALLDRNPILSLACQKAMVNQIDSPVVSNFISTCLIPIAEIELDFIRKQCFQAIPSLRAFVSRELREEAIALREADEEVVLREQLAGAFQDVASAGLEDLKGNIAIANRLIEENPEDYTGYKAKLISFMIAEAKYNESVPMAEYMELYDQMLQFGEVEFEADAGFLREPNLPEAGAPPPDTTFDAQEIGDLDSDLVHLPFK